MDDLVLSVRQSAAAALLIDRTKNVEKLADARRSPSSSDSEFILVNAARTKLDIETTDRRAGPARPFRGCTSLSVKPLGKAVLRMLSTDRPHVVIKIKQLRSGRADCSSERPRDCHRRISPSLHASERDRTASCPTMIQCSCAAGRFGR